MHTEEAKLRIVYETVERIAKDNSIDMPEVGYYESAEPNAFATGATKNKSLVAVST
jgi:heat shock protein HtpX